MRRLTKFQLPDMKGPGTASAVPADWKQPPDGAPMSRILHIGCARVAVASKPAPVAKAVAVSNAGAAPKPAAVTAQAPIATGAADSVPKSAPAPVAAASQLIGGCG